MPEFDDVFVSHDQEILAGARRAASSAIYHPLTLVAGPSGTGKSALVQWIVREQRRQGRHAPRYLDGAICRGAGSIAAFLAGSHLRDGQPVPTVVLEHLESVGSRPLALLQRAMTSGALRLLATARVEKRQQATHLMALLGPAGAAQLLWLPPLRERPRDAEVIAHALGTRTVPLTAAAQRLLGSVDWPQNVRDLKALVLAATQLARTRGLRAVPPDIARELLEGGIPPALGHALLAMGQAWRQSSGFPATSLRDVARLTEALVAATALRACDTNFTRAAAALNTPASTLKSRVQALAPELRAVEPWL